MTKFLEVEQEGTAYINEYKKLTPEILEKTRELASKIKGKNILHINSTLSGGGVAELLKSQVSLENSLGLKSKRLVAEAPGSFFVITKKMHNLLQGKPGMLTEEEKTSYLEVNNELGKHLAEICKKLRGGVAVIHDTQALLMVKFLPKNFTAILRLHVDFSSPTPTILNFLMPYIKEYPQIILSDPDYIRAFPWFPEDKIKIIMPAIDPFSEKNKLMDIRVAEEIFKQFNINTLKPTLTQVSRFDPWKDPLGVIQAYYLAKKDIPNLQLILAGFVFASDDPEADSIFKKVKKHAQGDPDIHLFFDPKELKSMSNDTFINALYTASTVVIQKSIREGFGLTITEAMWKGKAVIAGLTEGSTLQIKNGVNGLIISSPEEAANAIVHLLKNEELRDKMGKAARETVKKKFIMSRFVRDNIKVYEALLRTRK